MAKVKWRTPLKGDEIAKHTHKIYKTFALNCYNNLIALSPVDTGRYRRNHIISLNSPNTSLDGTGGIGLILGIAEGQFPTVFIQNNLPYVIRIEHGHSNQAPTGVYGNAFNSALGALP